MDKTMRVTVAHTPEHFQEKAVDNGWQQTELTVVIIDILRASTTIVTALMKGANRIVPCQTIEEAIAYAEEHHNQHCALAGERHAQKIEGFEFGNSPQEYITDAVKGKTIVMTTSNGTRAIRMAPQSEQVMVGCLLNAGSISNACAAIGNNVALICAGTHGKYSADDVIGAGGIIYQVIENQTEVELDNDAAKALRLFQETKDDLQRNLELTEHGQRLKQLGFEDDIAYAAQYSLFQAPVPVLQDGKPQYLTELSLS